MSIRPNWRCVSKTPARFMIWFPKQQRRVSRALRVVRMLLPIVWRRAKHTSAASGFWKPKESYLPQDRPSEIFSRQNLRQAIDDDLFLRAGSTADAVPSRVADSSCGEKITFSNRIYLGQFADTYLVFSGADGIMLVDQHAAHERIILERLKASSGQKIISQPLLMPEVVSLSPAQVSLFEDALNVLGEIGLEVEIFGRDALVVKAMPASLPHVPPRDIISDLADQLADQHTVPSLQDRKEKILASLACRAAIKANAALCAEEVSALCRDLDEAPFNATCPHGRPISVKFSLYEIERLFKRK